MRPTPSMYLQFYAKTRSPLGPDFYDDDDDDDNDHDHDHDDDDDDDDDDNDDYDDTHDDYIVHDDADDDDADVHDDLDADHHDDDPPILIEDVCATGRCSPHPGSNPVKKFAFNERAIEVELSLMIIMMIRMIMMML